MDYSRTERVGDQVQKELADLISFEIKDPRVGMVTINSVDVSRDFAYADVYITVLGQDLQDTSVIDASLKVLNKASGFLRSRLATRMRLRTVPDLRFYHDTSVEQGRKLSALIDQAVGSDKAQQARQSDDSDPDPTESSSSQDQGS